MSAHNCAELGRPSGRAKYRYKALYSACLTSQQRSPTCRSLILFTNSIGVGTTLFRIVSSRGCISSLSANDLHCGGIAGPPNWFQCALWRHCCPPICSERTAPYKMRNTTQLLEMHANNTQFTKHKCESYTHTNEKHTSEVLQQPTHCMRRQTCQQIDLRTANTRGQFYSSYAITHINSRINNEQVGNVKQHIPDTRGQCYSHQAFCVVMSIAVHLQWVY